MIRSLTGSFEPLPLARSPRASSSSPPPGDPDLFDYDSRFESTHRPCDLLWGPGDPAMPCSGSPVTTPRQTRSRPSTACSRSNTTATGSPSCAAQAPRRRLGPATGRHLVPDPGRHAVPRLQPSASPARRRARKAGEGDCQVCPAEILGNGGLPDMLRLAARLGADVTPRARADRTPHDVPHAHVQQDCAGRRLRHPTDDSSLARFLADAPGTKA